MASPRGLFLALDFLQGPRMPTNFQKAYILVLCVVVGTLLVLNVISATSGEPSSLLPAAIQVAVLVAIYLRKSWTSIAVRVWAAIGMLSGVAMWLAVLLRGGTFTQSTSTIVFRTVMLIICLGFFVFAKRAFQSRESEI